jgi:hypothetical protein
VKSEVHTMRAGSSIQFKSFCSNGLGLRLAVLSVFGLGIAFAGTCLWAAPSGTAKNTETQVICGLVQANTKAKEDKADAANSTLKPVLKAVESEKGEKSVVQPVQAANAGPSSKTVVHGNRKNTAGITGSSADKLSKAVFQTLDSKRMSIDYQEMTFRDVIQDLRSQLGINLIVYWPSLQQSGIDGDSLITLRLDNVPAEKVIDAVLAYASSGAAEKLAWNVDKGVLEIDVEGKLKEPYVVRDYYVADLAAQQSSMMGMGGMGYGGMGMMGGMGYGGMGGMGMMGMGGYGGGGRGFGYSGYGGGYGRGGYGRGGYGSYGGGRYGGGSYGGRGGRGGRYGGGYRGY